MLDNMERRRVLKAAASVGIIGGLAGCSESGNGGGDGNGGDGGGGGDGDGNGDNSDQPSFELTSASGGDTSTGFAMLTGWSQMLRDVTNSRINITNQTTGGGLENVQRMSQGEYPLGYMGSGSAGELNFEELDVFPLFTYMAFPTLFWVTDAGRDDLKYTSDVEGNAVSIGAPGSSMSQYMMSYLENINVNTDSMDIQRQDYGAGLTLLEDGRVDASIIYTSGNSVGSTFQEFLTRREGQVKILPPHPDEQNWSTGLLPWEPNVAKAFGKAWELSVGGDQDTWKTGASVAGLASTTEITYDQAYALTDLTIKNADSLPEYHDLWGLFAEDNSTGTGLMHETYPYHPGAADAWRDHDLWPENSYVADKSKF